MRVSDAVEELEVMWEKQGEFNYTRARELTDKLHKHFDKVYANNGVPKFWRKVRRAALDAQRAHELAESMATTDADRAYHAKRGDDCAVIEEIAAQSILGD